MGKVIRLTESDLTKIVKRVIRENEEQQIADEVTNTILSNISKEDLLTLGKLYNSIGEDEFKNFTEDIVDNVIDDKNVNESIGLSKIGITVDTESEKDKIQYDDYQARHNEYLARKAEGNKINGPRDIVNAAERNEQKEEAAQPTQNSGGNWLFFVGIFLTLFFGGAPWLLPWVDKKKALK
jgi:hypothetical protein